MHKPLLIFAALVAFAPSCVDERWEPNPEFCTNALGDQTCAERFPDGSRPFCVVSECLDAHYGCFPFEPTVECASPCGREDPDCEAGMTMESSGSGSDSGTDSGGSESGSGSSTTGPQPCMADADCTGGAAPFCEPTLGECVGCDGMPDPDMACSGLEAGTPVCVEGECRQCTAAMPDECTGDTPVCDEETNACVPCTDHDQCGDAACNFFTGACLPAGEVVRVGPGQRFTTLGAAVSSFGMGGEGTIIVHQDDYLEAVTVNGGRVLAFLTNEGDSPVWDTPGASTAPQLTVTDGTVLIDGLEISGNGAATAAGLRVDGGQVWADRSRVVQNSGGGVLAQNAAQLVLRNCFVGGNASDVDAVALNASTLDMLYTTVGGGTVLGGRARALYCEGAATATVRNSILVSADPMAEVECPGVTLETSATEAEAGTLDIGWFNGYAGGDFSLTAAGAMMFGETAVWLDGDPLTDIEGDPRPGVADSPDFAGADAVP